MSDTTEPETTIAERKAAAALAWLREQYDECVVLKRGTTIFAAFAMLCPDGPKPIQLQAVAFTETALARWRTAAQKLVADEEIGISEAMARTLPGTELPT